MVADALSRAHIMPVEQEDNNCFAVTTIFPGWCADVAALYDKM